MEGSNEHASRNEPCARATRCLVGGEIIVVDSAGYGVSVVNDATVAADRLRSEHNAGSGFGIVSATNEASATITDCVFAHNRGNGVVADAAAFATTRIQVDRSVMASDLGRDFSP